MYVIVDLESGTVIGAANVVLVDLDAVPAQLAQDALDSDSDARFMASTYGQPLI